MSSAAPDSAAPATDAHESLITFASRHRRRAARDGAWKVEITERSSRGVTTRSIVSWHWHDESAREPRPQASRTPTWRASRTPARSSPSRTARQQRSFERSAARHHHLARIRLRATLIAALAAVRLRRALCALQLRRLRLRGALLAVVAAVRLRHVPLAVRTATHHLPDPVPTPPAASAAPPPPPPTLPPPSNAWHVVTRKRGRRSPASSPPPAPPPALPPLAPTPAPTSREPPSPPPLANVSPNTAIATFFEAEESGAPDHILAALERRMHNACCGGNRRGDYY